MKIYLIIFCLISHCVYGWFEYQRALSALEANDLDTASQLMGAALLDKPFDPHRLYDAGVIAYKQEDFKQALDYFKTSATQENVTTSLLEKIHFNAGNAHFKLEELESAIEQYDLTLGLNPDNEQARANKKLAEDLLEKKRQEDKQQQQQDNKQNQDQQQSKQDKQKNQQQKGNGNKENQDRSQDGQDQEQEGQDGQDSQQDQQGSGSDKQNQQNDQKQSGSNKNERQKSQQRPEKKAEDLFKDAEQQNKQNANNQAQNQKQDARDADRKESEQSKTQPSGVGDNGQEQQELTPEDIEKEVQAFLAAQNQDLQAMDPVLQEIAQANEKRDKEMNKALMQYIVGDKGKRNAKRLW